MGLLTTLKQNDVFRDEYSLAFDGTNDYVDCGTNFESTLLNSDFSFSIWVKFVDGRPPSTDLYMFGTKDGNDNFWFRIETDGDVAFYYKEGTTQSNLVASGYLADGASNWIHFVGTLSDSAQKIYANGVVIASGTASLDTSGFAQDTNRNLVIGARNNAGTVGNYLPCNISEVAFYTSVLTANQVKTIYNGREPYNHKEGVASGNLQAWYRMGDGALDGFNPDAATNGLIQSYNSQLESSIVTSWTNGSAGFNTLNTTGTNITSMINNDSGTDNVRSNSLTVAVTDIYKISFDVAGTTVPTAINKLMFKFSPNAALNSSTYGGSITHTGSYVFYVSPATTTIYVGFRAVEDVDCNITNFKMQKVTNNAGLMTNMAADDFEGDTP